MTGDRIEPLFDSRKRGQRHWSPYASLCIACEHLSSRHLLANDALSVAGPYHCLDCSCVISQEHPSLPLNEREYKAWAAEHPDNVWKPDA